jgi:predicted acylesterase/phospholipase RssA
MPALHINNKPSLFRTWQADRNPGPNPRIWEAGRATSAAPKFFKRIAIGSPNYEEEFIDGGIGCNNPVQSLIEEAKEEFDSESQVGCIVSIGTGSKIVSSFRRPGLFQRQLPVELIKTLVDLATSSDDKANLMETRCKNYPGLYHRFNVDKGLEKISLEEWDKLGEVKTHTLRYLQSGDISQKMDDVVDSLLGRTTRSYPISQLGV